MIEVIAQPKPCKWRGKCKICAFSHVVPSIKEMESEKYEDTIGALKREIVELQKDIKVLKEKKSSA